MTQRLQKNNDLNTYFKELSIQINLDGLSFCVFNPVERCVESVYNFPINLHNKLREEVERDVHAVIESEGDLRQDFDSIRVLHNTPQFALIPQPLCGDRGDMLAYLKYSVDVTDVPAMAVEVDKLHSIEVVNAYLPNVAVNEALRGYYGRFDYQHFATALLRMFLKHYATHAYEMMYVYAEAGSFYFVVFRGKRLCYFNRFGYETIEDFLYYILFSIEQLDIDTERVGLYIAGEVATTALLYSRVRRYVKYIYLLKYHKERFGAGMNEELIRRNFVLTQL